MREHIRAIGHEHVTAEHTSTFEITSDDWLTPAGDCILGVESSSTPATFEDAFVSACQSRDSTIIATLRAGQYEQVIEGHGHPKLSFENDRSMVFRTSDHVDDRTVMIEADAAAGDIDRNLVEELETGADLECVLEIDTE